MSDPYTTEANLIRASSRETLIKLTDDYSTGAIVSEHVVWAIEQGDNEIDLHCRGRYPVDMDTEDIPEFIVTISTVLAMFHLYSRRLTLTLPEPLSKAHSNAMKNLRDIQAGKLTPWPTAAEPSIILSNKTAASKAFSPTFWKGYDR